jgi:ABC-2 type transport system ATP-binding protein
VRTDGATALLSSHIVTDVEQACDRLVVLGVGHILLHDTVSDSLATHWMATNGVTPPDAEAIGSFGGPRGERLTLLRRQSAPGAETLRPASLEEVVLGYLASARAIPGEAAA